MYKAIAIDAFNFIGQGKIKMVDTFIFNPDVVGYSEEKAHSKLHGDDQRDLKIKKTIKGTYKGKNKKKWK